MFTIGMIENVYEDMKLKARKCKECGKDCSLKYCSIGLGYSILSRCFDVNGDENHFCSESCVVKHVCEHAIRHYSRHALRIRILWFDLQKHDTWFGKKFKVK